MNSVLKPQLKMDEVNFDGLIGPTHHFAGLAFGNIASMSNKGRASNPKNAALQGLKKMKILYDLGLKQGVIAPVCRPNFEILKNLGFSGSREVILKQLSQQPVEMVSAFFSASSMWTANSSTVSPSQDTQDRKVHFTPANLTAKFHRSLEPQGTTAILRAMFNNEKYFKVHDPLFPNLFYGDEGAANHTRFCESYGSQGLEFFVYGRKAFGKNSFETRRFPARQSFEASQAVARLHQLSEERVVFWQQNPAVIDEGAFHNDVVAVGNLDTLFYHELAFVEEDQLIEALKSKFSKISQQPLSFIRVKSSDVPLKEAVKSYLFNSQIIQTPQGDRVLIAPVESEENDSVRNYLQSGEFLSLVQKVQFVDLRESMLNGGGPACLRLRVVLSAEELQAVNPGVLLSDSLFNQLEKWIQKYYRDRLSGEDLFDIQFINEIENALDELTQILKIGSVYPFQTIS